MTGSGWRVAGGGSGRKKVKIKGETEKEKKIINITKSDILAIFFYTISHVRDSLRNS